ncbi:ATP-binding cassette domain-containing protein [Propionibacteriaceae bacterium Y2011]
MTHNALRRSPIPAAILVAFVALASMLAGSASGLLVTTTGASEALMRQAETPHLLQMHAGPVDLARLQRFAENDELVEEWSATPFLNVDGSAIRVTGDGVARAESLLARAGIGGLGGRFPSQVSGGQLQRAGICRALMREPRILFGDEPTGALNSRAADEVMDLLGELNAEGTALLVVTHDANVAARADRVVFMKDGRIADEVQLDGTDLVAAINTSMQELAI